MKISEKLINKDLLNKIPKNKFIIGYVGTLGTSNTLHPLVNAARILSKYKNIIFLIVGDGKDKKNLKFLAHGSRRCILIDKIEKVKMPSLLGLIDVCYIRWLNKKTYKYDIFANKIFAYAVLCLLTQIIPRT